MQKLTSTSSRPEVFLKKDVRKICSKFTEEHPCRSVISIKLQSNFTEITLRHGCSPVNLLLIFRTPFSKSNSRWLLPNIRINIFIQNMPQMLMKNNISRQIFSKKISEISSYFGMQFIRRDFTIYTN